MFNPDADPKQEGGEANDVVVAIQERLRSASAKVVERVGILLSRFLEHPDNAPVDLAEMQNDFYDDELIQQRYKGWSKDEIKEFYSVLYGEDME